MRITLPLKICFCFLTIWDEGSSGFPELREPSQVRSRPSRPIFLNSKKQVLLPKVLWLCPRRQGRAAGVFLTASKALGAVCVETRSRRRSPSAEPHPVHPAGASGPSAPHASWASRPRRWCAAPRTSCTTCIASPAWFASGSWPRGTNSTSWKTAGWCARRTTKQPSSEVSGRRWPSRVMRETLSPGGWGRELVWCWEVGRPEAPGTEQTAPGACSSGHIGGNRRLPALRELAAQHP